MKAKQTTEKSFFGTDMSARTICCVRIVRVGDDGQRVETAQPSSAQHGHNAATKVAILQIVLFMALIQCE